MTYEDDHFLMDKIFIFIKLMTLLFSLISIKMGLAKLLALLMVFILTGSTFAGLIFYFIK